MEPSLRLICLSVAMFLGCFVFGYIPLTLTISQKKMRFVSIIGAGLIVGTALSVIIPEGVHAMHEHEHEHVHDHSNAHEDERHKLNYRNADTTRQVKIFLKIHINSETILPVICRERMGWDRMRYKQVG